MKKATFLSMIMLVLVISFGCKKDKETTAPSLSVKFDGTTWNAKVFSATYFANEHLIMILGSNSTASQMINVNAMASDIGTYTFNPTDNANLNASYSTVAGDDYSTFLQDNPYGQIKITEFDKTNKTLSGSFYFDGYTFENVKKSFTEGKFVKIPYVLGD